MRARTQTLNVADSVPDDTLSAVLDKIDNKIESRIGSIHSARRGENFKNAVLDLLARDVPRTGAPIALDLIGHAREGVLHLGQWSIEKSSDPHVTKAFKVSAEKLAEHNVTMLRLLGCGTGTGQGIGAMKWLQEIVDRAVGPRIVVKGARQLLNASNFGKDQLGLSETTAAALISARRAKPRILTTDALDRWWATLPHRSRAHRHLSFLTTDDHAFRSDALFQRESADDVTFPCTHYGMGRLWDIQVAKIDMNEFLRLFATRPFKKVSGLLELPSIEIAIPSRVASDERAQLYHRVSLYFRERFARVYPVGVREGLMFRLDRSRRRRLRSTMQGSPLLPTA